MRKIQIKIYSIIIFFALATTSYAQDLVFGKSKEKPVEVSQNVDKFQINETEYYQKTELIDLETVEVKLFDKEDRLAVKKIINAEGNLYYDEKGIAIYEYEYDNRNNVITVRYYDEFRMPYSINDAGPATIKKEYDTKDRLTKVIYLDVQGELFSHGGASIVEYVYNEKNQVQEERRYLKLEVLIDYVAPIIRYKYDTENRIIEQTYYDKDGKSTAMMNDKTDDEDFAKIIFEYLGGQTIPTFFNWKGKEIAPF